MLTGYWNWILECIVSMYYTFYDTGMLLAVVKDAVYAEIQEPLVDVLIRCEHPHFRMMIF